jgi:hypothetical protein
MSDVDNSEKDFNLVRRGFMVYNTTFNNISVISWQSI